MVASQDDTQAATSEIAEPLDETRDDAQEAASEAVEQVSDAKDEIKAIANEMAERLGETQYGPRMMLRALIHHCGVDFARQIMQEALEIEEQGGMLTTEGDRRRTVGGIFFYLARERMPQETRRAVFPRAKNASNSKPSLHWPTRIYAVQRLLKEQGEVTNVKITLVGRPGKIDARRDVVITTMAYNPPRDLSLPKGVPQLPRNITVFTVYIGIRQWRKVEAALAAPDDALIIEGVCAYDKDLKAISVHAVSVTTKHMEMEKRERQQAESLAAKGEAVRVGQAEGTDSASEPAARAPKAAPAAKTKASRSEPAMPPSPIPAVPEIKLPDNVTPEDAQKLSGLYAAAELYRQKIATIEAKPENQRFGLEMTQKLLKNAQDEIASIEKRYA